MSSEGKQIVLFGAYYTNKGASLLIETVKSFHPKDRLAIPIGFSMDTYKKNRTNEIESIFFLRIGPYNMFDLFHFFPKKMLARLGIGRLRDFEFMYDISGFAYGAHWSVNVVKYANAIFRYSPKKLVVMPQAFGRFGHNREIYKSYFDSAMHIYARDSVSLKNITELNLNVSPKLSPDITFALKVERSELKYDLLVIPNYKLIERSIYSVEEWCFQLNNIIKNNPEIKSAYFLIHEGPNDEMLALEYNQRFSHSLEILKGYSGIECKEIIAQAKVVLSARYHGVISALSTGAITYSYSWSHKYVEIMKEFDLEQNLISPAQSDLKIDFNIKPSEQTRILYSSLINNELLWYR